VLILALGVGIGASGIAADVRAEDTPPAPAEADDDGGQPSLGMGFLLHRQEQTGAVEGGLGSTLGGPGNTDAAVSPGFRFDADLMSPPLLDIDLAPKLFFQVGAQVLLEDEFIAYRNSGSFANSESIPLLQLNCLAPPADLDPDRLDDGWIRLPNDRVATCAIDSKVSMAIDAMWYMGVGIDLTLPVWERRVHLRASVDYSAQSISANGSTEIISQTQFVCLARLGCVPDPPDSARSDLVTTTDRNNGSASRTSHGVGFGLSMNADVYRFKSIRVDLFLETRFAWLISGSSLRFVGVDSNPVLNSTFVIRPDEFFIQGGGGIRVRWMPKW
jgi:hypothetical protein